MRPPLLAALACFLLSACTHVAWVKPSGDPATFPADSYLCKQDSLKAAPPVFETHDLATPVARRFYRDCSHDPHGGERCHMIVLPDESRARPQTVDLNKNVRDDLYQSCLEAKGWVLQAVEGPSP